MQLIPHGRQGKAPPARGKADDDRVPCLSCLPVVKRVPSTKFITLTGMAEFGAGLSRGLYVFSLRDAGVFPEFFGNNDEAGIEQTGQTEKGAQNRGSFFGKNFRKGIFSD